MDCFNEREKKIIKIIGKRKMTFEDISTRYWKDSDCKPFDHNISIANSIRRIIRKCDHHGLNWTLIKERKNLKIFISKGAR